MKSLLTDSMARSPSLPFTQSIVDCRCGALTDDAVARRLAETGPVLARLAEQTRSGALPHFTIPYRTDDLAPQVEVAKRIAGDCRQVVLLGTGGSSLGPQAIAQLVQTPFGGPVDRPRLGFLDNLDPASLAASLASCDLAESHFIVASKSGSTALSHQVVELKSELEKIREQVQNIE